MANNGHFDSASSVPGIKEYVELVCLQTVGLPDESRIRIATGLLKFVEKYKFSPLTHKFLERNSSWIKSMFFSNSFLPFKNKMSETKHEIITPIPKLTVEQGKVFLRAFINEMSDILKHKNFFYPYFFSLQ